MATKRTARDTGTKARRARASRSEIPAEPTHDTTTNDAPAELLSVDPPETQTPPAHESPAPLDTRDPVAGMIANVTGADAGAADSLAALDALANASNAIAPDAPAPSAAPESGKRGRDYAAEHARRMANKRGVSLDVTPATHDSARLYGGRKTRAALEAENAALTTRVESLEASITRMRVTSNDDVVKQLNVTLGAIFGATGKVLARMRGPHWAFTDEERDMLASVWTPVAAQHADAINEHAPWLAAVSVTGMIVLERLDRDAELEAQRVRLARAQQLDATVTP